MKSESRSSSPGAPAHHLLLSDAVGVCGVLYKPQPRSGYVKLNRDDRDDHSATMRQNCSIARLPSPEPVSSVIRVSCFMAMQHGFMHIIAV